MPDIARAVAGVLKNSDETANKHISVRSVQTSQNELLAEFEAQTGEKWTVTKGKAADLQAEAEAKIAAGDRSGFGWLAAVQLFTDGSDRSIVISREEAVNDLVGVSEKDTAAIVRAALEA
jgi:hypothetical protein